MKLKAQVAFEDEETAFDQTLVDGVPTVEAVTEISVGPCVVCEDEDADGGMIVNVRVENGVLTGDNICMNCCPKDSDDPEWQRIGRFWEEEQ